LIVTVFLALKGANQYKVKFEGEDNIRIVYNDKRYSSCREINGDDIETFRVGFRVIGKKPVRNPTVTPVTFHEVVRPDYYIKHGILSSPFSQLVQTAEVYPGLTPSCWFNILKHRLNSNFIELCYEGIKLRGIKVRPGQYRLNLVGRGSDSNNNNVTLIISVDDDLNINVDIEGIDYLNSE
jgi:hypothetical protein